MNAFNESAELGASGWDGCILGAKELMVRSSQKVEKDNRFAEAAKNNAIQNIKDVAGQYPTLLTFGRHVVFQLVARLALEEML